MIEFKELIVKGGEVAVLFFELLALIMIIYAGCKGAISLFKKDDNVALDLLKGFSTGLSFLLGAEILKTIALEEVSELNGCEQHAEKKQENQLAADSWYFDICGHHFYIIQLLSKLAERQI